jgi:serine/threonine-protein kinase
MGENRENRVILKAMDLPTGHTLHDRFRIIRLLGKGGMGSVYYAHDPVLNRYVAIKQLEPALPTSEHANEQLRRQFLKEAQILASLHHPNLPRVTDYFIEDDSHYLIMDYIEGQSLQDMLVANKQGFPEDLVLEWADQLMSALEYIHANNVIHRDIKPANIRRTTDGRIFLVDFGLVKSYNLNDPRTMTMFHGIGTPEYAPPEQYDPGVHTDQRSDIYALGATLYHLLTGMAPISVTRRTSEPSAFAMPRQAKAEISPTLEQAILRSMEIERAKRFATASDMRAALNLVRRPYLVDATRTTDLSAIAAPEAAVVVPAHPNRRRRALALISVLLLFGLGTVSVVALQGSTSAATPTLTPTRPADSIPAGAAKATATATSTATGTPTSTPTISATQTITLTGTAAVIGTVTVTPASGTQSGGGGTGQVAPAATKKPQPTAKPTNSNTGGGNPNSNKPPTRPPKAPKS